MPRGSVKIAQQALRQRVVTQFLRPASPSGFQAFKIPTFITNNLTGVTATAAVNLGKEIIEMIRYIPSNLYNKMQFSVGSDQIPNSESLTSNQSKPDSTLISKQLPKPQENQPSENPTPEDKSSSGIKTGALDPVLIANRQEVEAQTLYLLNELKKHVDILKPPELIHKLSPLYTHIYNYEGARQIAIQHGIFKLLFKILKLHSTDEPIKQRTQELLAIMGHVPPVKGRGVRILSLDGGGIRGLVAIEILRVLEDLTGKRTHELFDYICGVSTGSILAFLLGVQCKTLNETERLYKELGCQIFKQNSWYGTANMLWSHSYYPSDNFEEVLRQQVGLASLISHNAKTDLPRVSAISTVVNQERITPYVFRTYAIPVGVRARHPGGFRYKMWEAVRASAAAPTYFTEHKLGKHLHQDGGVMSNNPSAIALSECKALWRGVPLQCLVSIGTGRSLTSLPDQHAHEYSEGMDTSSTPDGLTWKGKFLKVLDSATDTEGVHNTLNELLPHDVYFRFNPYLAEVPKLDEAIPEKLEKLQLETKNYLQRNIQRATFTAETLSKKKTAMSKVTDYLSKY